MRIRHGASGAIEKKVINEITVDFIQKYASEWELRMVCIPTLSVATRTVKALAIILEAVHDADFYGFSHAFREGHPA